MKTVVLSLIIAIAILFIILPLLLMIIDSFCRYRGIFFCKFFGWHKKPEDIKISGINRIGICPRCGKKVMQDSQGNWF